MDKIEKLVPKRRFKEFIDCGAWEQHTLGEIVDFLDSQRKPLESGTRISGKYPYYGASGVIDSVSDYIFEEELILLSEDGANIIDRNYRVCFLAQGKYWVNNHAHVLKSKEGLENRFICEALEKLDYTKYNTGTAQPKLNQEVCRKIKFMITKYEEQTKISKFLFNIDYIIILQQRKLEKIKALKSAYLTEMFPDKGVHKPKRRIIGFNEEWKQCKLSEIIDVHSGKDYKHLLEGAIPVYGTGGYMLSVNKALSYDENAIGIGRKGTIDKPYILKAPFWTVDTLFYSFPRKENDINFLFNIFHNIDWKRKDESTGVPSLSKITINEIKVLIPKYSEQKRIGEFFIQIDNLIIQHQQKLEKLHNIKKAFLNEMFI